MAKGDWERGSDEARVRVETGQLPGFFHFVILPIREITITVVLQWGGRLMRAVAFILDDSLYKHLFAVGVISSHRIFGN